MTGNLRRSIDSGNGSSQNMAQGIAEAYDSTTAKAADSLDRQSNLALDIQVLQILDSSDDCIKVLDLDGRIQFMSRGGQVLLGIQDIAPFLHTSWIEFWQGADQQVAVEAIAKAKAGDVCTFQGYCPTPSGEPKWWEIKVSPIRGAEGQVEQLLCISRDITERRQIEDQRQQAEEKLRESEERYRAIVNQAVTGVACTDLDGNVTLVNQTYCDITGYSADELRQRRMQDITHPEDLPRNAELFCRMRTDGTPFEIEKRYIRKDGSVVWVNNSVSVIRDRDGKPQSAVAIVLDITERKQVALNAEFLATVTQDLAEATFVEDIIQAVGEHLHRYLQVSNCAFVEINESQEVAAIHHSWHLKEVPSLVGDYQLAEFVTDEFLQMAKAGRPIIIRDVATDPRIAGPEEFKALSIGSFINIPLIRENEWKFTLNIYHQTPYDWRSDEIELMHELANRIWTKLERARAEADLYESEAKYRSLFESMNDGFCIIELIYSEQQQPIDYRFLETNLAFERQSGLSDPIGKTGLYFAPNHDPKLLANYQQALVTGEPIEFEMEMADLGRYYRISANRHGDLKKKQLAIVFDDITERKLAEEQLRDSAEQQQFLLNFSDTLRVLSDKETIERTSLQLLAEYLRLDRVYIAAVHSSDDRAVIGPEYYKSDLMPMAGELPLSDFPEAFRIVEEQTLVIDNIADYPTLSDRDRQSFAAINLTALVVASTRRGERNVIWSVLAAMTTPRNWTAGEVALLETVAERTWAAVERANAEATTAADLQNTQLLRELSVRLTSEADIQVLYNEIMAAAIILTQADAGTVQILDETTQDLVLIATQGINQKMVEHFHRVNARSNTPCGIALRSSVRSFIDFDVSTSEDPDGSMRLHVEGGLLSAQSTPLISRSGKPIGMVSTHWRTRHRPSERELRFLDLLARQAADLIEQRQAEAQRKQLLEREQAAREEAERANRIKDEFLAVLSHELRSPLNPILGWSKLLRGGKLDEAKTAQALATIERNAKLQSELIEDLLDVSRILQGKLSLNVAPVNLAVIIRGAMETVRLAAEAKSIPVEANLAPDVGQVLGDSTRLQQVIWNLLSNAVKFTPGGGQVNIRLERLNSSAQITVSDMGQGIAPDFLPYVFDYFRQADGATTRKFGGLGLGLAIVRHLVELHGGTVKADSLGEGQGATFTIRLPLLHTPSQANQNEESPQQSLDLSDIKILVVDNEPDTRELVAFVLEQQGAQVIAATSAHEALLVLPQAKPDVLLSDIGMPEMDGYMLIQQIRELTPDQGGQIPAIALTAYAGDINQQQVLAAGFQKHISKPIEPEELVQAIVGLVRST